MKKIFVNKKVLIGTIAATVIAAAVVIPVAVVYGTKKSSNFLEKTGKDIIAVPYGTKVVDLVKLLPAAETGYKPPELEVTDYKDNSPLTADGVIPSLTATYIYRIDGTVNTLESTRVLYTLKVVKNEIILSDVPDVALKNAAPENIIFGTDVDLSINKPANLTKYTQWVHEKFVTNDGTTDTEVNLVQIKALDVGKEFIAIYSATPGANYFTNEETLKTVHFRKTFKVVKATAESLPITTAQKNYVFASAIFPITLDQPKTLLGYDDWSKPVDNSGTELTLAMVSSYNVGQTFTAKYSTVLKSNYEGPATLNYTITYTVTQASAIPYVNSSSTADFIIGTATMPKTDEKTGQLVGYNAWTVVYKSGTTVLTKIEELNSLNAGNTFTATYTATKDSNYNITSDATHVVTYTVKPGVADADPSGTGTPKIYLNNSTELPADKKSTDRVLGWLNWTVKYTSGANTYSTLAELNALPARQTFTATYTALKDPNFLTTTDAVYTVEYTVKIPGTPITSTTFTENYTYGTTAPELHKPTAKQTGYLDWSAVVYTHGTTVITAQEVSALEIDETFTATYSTSPDLDYDGITTPITITVTYTVQKIQATAFVSTTHQEDYIFASTAPTLHDPGAQVVGYKPWVLTYKQGSVVKTAAEIEALNAGATFTATYEAEFDPHYTPTTNATVVVTYTVKPKTATPFVSTTKAENYTYGSTAPTLHDPGAQVVGYKPWVLTYMYGAAVKTAEELKTIEINQTFTATYRAEPDTNYTITTAATVVVTYTVVKIDVTPAISETISADYTYSQNDPETNKPTNKEGYLAWSTVSYKQGTVAKTLAQIKALEVDQLFTATYTAQPDPHYTTVSAITFTINFKVIKIVGTNVPPQVFNDEVYYWRYGPPTTHSPMGTTTVGYKAWTFAGYTQNGTSITQSQAQNLEIGGRFTQTYSALADTAHYTNVTDTTITVNFIVTKRVATAYTPVTSTGPNFKIGSGIPSAAIAFPSKGSEYNSWFLQGYKNSSGASITLTQVQALAVGQTFTAEHAANLSDPAHYSGTSPIIFTISYTVVA